MQNQITIIENPIRSLSLSMGIKRSPLLSIRRLSQRSEMNNLFYSPSTSAGTISCAQKTPSDRLTCLTLVAGANSSTPLTTALLPRRRCCTPWLEPIIRMFGGGRSKHFDFTQSTAPATAEFSLLLAPCFFLTSPPHVNDCLYHPQLYRQCRAVYRVPYCPA